MLMISYLLEMMNLFAEFKRSMMLEFDMTDLGKMRYFLGIEVMQRTDGIFISQKKYALEVLEKFGMNKCNPVLNPIVPGCKLLRDEDGVKVDSTIYKQIVGSLMYLTATRPDMMFVVSLISSSGAVSWSSKKQPIVTLSTTEAEFIAAASCACQVVWLRRIFEMLGKKQDRPTVVHCDSSSAIKLAKNLVMHGCSKHIDVCFHFLHELIKAGTVEMVHCNSQEQIADVMTKPLKLDAFVKLRSMLGVCP
ncbi:unnamed protein product [Prunus brigantina]